MAADNEGDLVHPDDLWDSRQGAEYLGLSGGPDAFAVYAARYPDFPKPLIDRGRCKLYRRQDFDEFLVSHPRIGRKRTRDSGADPS